MKPSHKLLTFLLGSTLLAAVATTTNAATFYWDSNDTSVGFGDADGTWGTSPFWSTDPTGESTATNATTTTSDTVNFGTATLAYGTATRTITLSGNRSVGSMVFGAAQTSTVGFATTAGSNFITLAGGGSIVVDGGNHVINGTGTSTSLTSRDLTFSGAGASFNIAADSSFEIKGRAGGGLSTANYVKTGAGTLIFSGQNGGGSGWNFNNGGLFTISEGVVRLANTNANGNSGNSFTVSNGAALELAGDSSQTVNNGIITLNGTGIGGNGALRSISPNNTITGSSITGGGVNLATNSSIGVDEGASLSIAPIIQGSGNLTKVGSGTLTLSGVNTFTGSTTIAAGTLEVRGSIAESSSITNEAALVFNSASAQSYSNPIGGSGTLTKQGAGTLTLTGNNAYTGNTTISGGVLQIGNGGTAGTLGANSNTFIDSGAELRIDRLVDSPNKIYGYDYSGELSGSGTVNILSSRRFNFRANQENSGNLSFTVDGILGINTGSGVTSVQLGEISGSGTIQRAGAAPTNPPLTTITIGSKNTSSTYSGGISNISEFAIDKVGSGTLTLEGSYGHGGGTTVTAGTLLVNGSLTSSSNAVTVDTNGTLGGSGTIAGATTVNGNLTPGTSPGVLGFSNSLALEASATTTMEIATTGMVRGTDYDGVDVGTTLGLNGDLMLNLGSTFNDGIYVFDLFAVTGSTSGNFNSVALEGAYGDHLLSLSGGVWETTTNRGNQTWSFSQTSGDLTLTVIPEPRAALLGSLGLLMLFRRRRGGI